MSNVLKHSLWQKCLFKSTEEAKDVYDWKHSLPNSFSEGEFVLKKDFKRKKRAGAKLETQYVGPYMIMKIHGKGFYRLKQVGNEECVVERINGAHLKPYQVADESSEVKNTVEKKIWININQKRLK